MRLLTWIIEYADGMYQEIDATSRRAARNGATHGAPIYGVWTHNQWNDRRKAFRAFQPLSDHDRESGRTK